VDYLPIHISSNCAVFDGDKLFIQKRKELYPALAKTHKEARNMANEWLLSHFEKLVVKEIKEYFSKKRRTKRPIIN
jgi:hypothetical protein